MRFDRVQQSLKNLEEKETVTVSEILGVFSDLCGDVGSLEDLPVGDIRKTVTGMCSTRRVLNRVYKAHEEEFSLESCQKRFDRIQGEAGENESRQDRLAQKLEELYTEEKKVLRGCRKKEAALLEVQKRISDCQEGCRKLQSEIEEAEKERVVLEGQYREEKERWEKERERNREKAAEIEGEKRRAEQEEAKAQEILQRVLEEQKQFLTQADRQARLLADVWEAFQRDVVLSGRWEEAGKDMEKVQSALNREKANIEESLKRYRKTYQGLLKQIEEREPGRSIG